MSKWVILMTVLVVLGVSQPVVSAETEQLAAKAPSPATVKIERVWRQQSHGAPYRFTARSLGTVIGPNWILTHNHFGIPLGLTDDTLAITDSAGRSTNWRAADVQLIIMSAGTRLLWVPDSAPPSAAPVADQVTLQRLAAGDWLAVNYWDDTARQLVQSDFKIVRIQNGIARLADPDKLINAGDSGGGVFFKGQLVGNTWSIDTDRNGHALGTVNIALLPFPLSGYVK
jgi:hypothetical protein